MLVLNVEPCKRYYINAQFKNTIATEWTPVIDYVETISLCKPEPPAVIGAASP